MNQRKNQKLTPVRLSHLLGYSGAGAVVRSPNYLMVIKDTSCWTDKQGDSGGEVIYYVEQVKSTLGISDKELRTPPMAKEKKGWIEGVLIPAQIFPSWACCSVCDLLYCKPWREGQETFPLRCSADSCGGILEQFPWVIAHNKGYLNDVPWHYLTHKDSESSCRPNWDKAYLKVRRQGQSMALSCEICKSKTTFSPNEPVFWRGGQQPWRNIRPPEHVLSRWPMAQVLQVNDPRLHLVERKSALVIPPESRIRQNSIESQLYTSTEKRLELDNAIGSYSKKQAMIKISRDLSCSVDELEQAIEQLENGYPLYGQAITSGNLLKGEYQALLEEIPNLQEDEDFVTKSYDQAWQALAQGLVPHSLAVQVAAVIENVIAVTRLKEIMVMMGFRRLGTEDEEGEQETLVPPDLDGQLNWLPALELYGEGIFISLDQALLQRWETQPELSRRLQKIANRLATAGQIYFEEEPKLSPRFMLLHALSHSLIRQLESHAGYPAASLKERIYCSRDDGMAGILIYVSVPDAMGSLGGLAELAEPKRLLPLLLNAVEKAEWCSLDPVCSEHEGQGPALLNNAACHACLLVPETSCQYSNVLLDRVFLKGSAQENMASIFDFVGRE